MEKKIKDYLHMYLGCEILLGDKEWMPLEHTYGLHPDVNPDYGRPVKTKLDAHILSSHNAKNIHLILRPISDMSEDDMPGWFQEWMPDGFMVLHQIDNNYHSVEIDSNNPDGFLLTIHQDGSMDCECKGNGWQYGYKGAEVFKHLLFKHFDLFGLIDAGLAIDKTKL